MQRASTLIKIVAVIAVLLVMPSIVAAFDVAPACGPMDCPGPCGPGYWDCTYEWVMSSGVNFAIAMYLASMGYSVYVCCLL